MGPDRVAMPAHHIPADHGGPALATRSGPTLRPRRRSLSTSGSSAVTQVPLPTVLWIRAAPPKSRARSYMPSNPKWSGLGTDAVAAAAPVLVILAEIVLPVWGNAISTSSL